LKLKPVHVSAALLLSDGEHTVAQVSKKVRRSLRTLERWQADPDFASLVTKVAEEIVNAAIKYQRTKTLAAAQTVADLMESGGEHDNVKLRAAQDTLDRVLGKPAQHQIITGDPDAPVAVVAGPRKQVKRA